MASPWRNPWAAAKARLPRSGAACGRKAVEVADALVSLAECRTESQARSGDVGAEERLLRAKRRRAPAQPAAKIPATSQHRRTFLSEIASMYHAAEIAVLQRLKSRCLKINLYFIFSNHSLCLFLNSSGSVPRGREQLCRARADPREFMINL